MLTCVLEDLIVKFALKLAKLAAKVPGLLSKLDHLLLHAVAAALAVVFSTA